MKDTNIIEPCEMPCGGLPDDCLVFESNVIDVKPLRPNLFIPLEMMSMLREAKEKHMAVMFTNEDETRALLIKDVNDLNMKITVNGVPFEEI